ncbi:hypothetical protein [Duganella callida]|uniref:Uncharacterized protein n=1 Tax=Duganella callida TaxID=2561932 RepID=A0A4Y9SR18_9BURK|nr:hypothetical protein [Duganella callida]TFW27927.1 hypothetical protein E4L98_06290 [Duganella callida]
MSDAHVIGIAVLLVVFIAPASLGLAGWCRLRRAPDGSRTSAWNWRLIVASALLYALAFDLTFFLQELFLVLPKALTPGLRPTLFHNNHTWQGQSPLTGLFQGTGALATLSSGILCAVLLWRGVGRSVTIRLFWFWMAYSGIFMALPQVVIGALVAQNDVGMAMAYFGMGTAGKTAAALVALAAIPLTAATLANLLPGHAPEGKHIADARERQHFVFRSATLPALLALPLIVLFRIPREWIEVLLVPVLVTMIGLLWMQAGAWRVGHRAAGDRAGAVAVVPPLIAVLALLLIFQLLLRPGIRFY